MLQIPVEFEYQIYPFLSINAIYIIVFSTLYARV